MGYKACDIITMYVNFVLPAILFPSWSLLSLKYYDAMIHKNIFLQDVTVCCNKNCDQSYYYAQFSLMVKQINSLV